MRLKKFLSIFLMITLLASAFAMNINAAEKLTAEVKKGTPTIDGVVDDIWSYANEIEIGRIKESGDSPNDGTGATGTFKLLWDDSNLYVIVFVNDTTRNNNGEATYTKDSIEIFLDPLNTVTDTYDDDDFRFCISADDIFNCENKDCDVKYKAVDGSASYIIEMAIPITSVVSEFKFASGTTFGWDIQLNDNIDGGDSRNHCKGWNDDANQAWQNATYMGTLVLSAEEAAPVVIEEVTEAATETIEPSAPVTTTPATTTTTTNAPQTNDTMVILLGLLMISAMTFIIIKRKRI